MQNARGLVAGPRRLGPASLWLTTALAVFLIDGRAAEAQSNPPPANLPTVNVQAPKQRAQRVQRAAPQRRVVRRAPAPRVAQPVPARPLAGSEPGERATGPVGGYIATRSATGTKTDTPILETPQSISVVPREQIEAQRPQNLTESLRYTPSASIEVNGGGSQFDYVNIRGLDVPQFRDGLRLPADPTQGFSRWRNEPYGLERIEVLRGPSSGIYGQASPAGIINMVSKRPTDTAFFETGIQGGSYGRLQGMFDFGGPIDANKNFLYRITGLGRSSDAEIDYNGDKRAFIAPAFTFRNETTSLTILGQYQKDDIKGPPHQFLPAVGTLLFNPNGRISRSTNVGDPETDRINREQYSVGYAFEHRFNDIFQFRQNFRYADVDIGFRSIRGEGLNPDLRTVTRSDIIAPSYATNFNIDNQLQADFVTGPLMHKALFGIDHSYLKSGQQLYFASTTDLDVFAPVYTRPNPVFGLFQDTLTTRQQTGIYAQDQIKLDRWILTLTGRQDFAQTYAADAVSGSSSLRNDSVFTGRAALGYLFDSGLAPYVSYATSFDPVAGTDRNGQAFRPTTGESVEAGVKYAPTFLPKTLFTAAVYDIKQKNTLTADVINPLFTAQTGAVHIRGAEFEARVNVMQGFNVIAALSYTSAETASSAFPGEIGKQLPLIPKTQIAVWGDYMIQSGALAGLGFGAGVRYTGYTFGDNEETLRLPGYTLLDAALYYDFGFNNPSLKGLKFDVSATNLTDKDYVSNCYGLNYCNYGAGRRVLATLRYRWQETPQPLFAKY